MATDKTYNSIDSKEQLMLVETGKGKFGGYKQDMLVNSLNETQIEFYVCTECNGVMRNACQRGEEQIPVCELCVGDRIGCQPMKKAREKIPELKVHCPLATRGCQWNTTIKNLDEHLAVCQEFIVKCKYGCGVILKRRERDDHCSNECLNRQVSCEHCEKLKVYRDLKQHYEECLEFPLLCPNNCGANLTRKQTDPHIETDCPNAIVKCRYERFGCREVVRRCEMDQHNKTNEIKHLEMGTFFTADEIGQLKETNSRLTEKMEQQERTILMLTEKLVQQKETISKLKEILEQVIVSLSYYVVLRSKLRLLFRLHNAHEEIFEFTWQSHKFMVSFKDTERYTISVSVSLANGGSLNWLQRGVNESRFKLTIIDRVNTKNSLVYKSPVIEPEEQPLYEFGIASIPIELLLEEGFRRENRYIEFTLQVQGPEQIRILDQIAGRNELR